MSNIVDFEVLAVVVVAAAVIAKLCEAIKVRLQRRWERLSDQRKEDVAGALVIVSAALMWLTGLNAFPGFSQVWAPAGRILTCIVAGFGPSLVYDMFMDLPAVTPQPPANDHENDVRFMHG